MVIDDTAACQTAGQQLIFCPATLNGQALACAQPYAIIDQKAGVTEAACGMPTYCTAMKSLPDDNGLSKQQGPVVALDCPEQGRCLKLCLAHAIMHEGCTGGYDTLPGSSRQSGFGQWG